MSAILGKMQVRSASESLKSEQFQGTSMAIDQEKISREFCFIHKSGQELFPIKIKRRTTGQVAFRISPGGTGGNTLDAAQEVDESTMIQKVLKEGYAVRCAPLDGKIKGLYKAGQRSIVNIKRL